MSPRRMRMMYSVILPKWSKPALTHVVLETTSHGWAQYRVDACEFDIGVVTNITHEHMDEHGSYENYRAAKARLFSSLETTLEKPQGNPRLGVINRDDPKSFDFLNDFIKVKKLNYGLGEKADVPGGRSTTAPSGIHFTARSKDFRVGINTRLVGAYNVSNCLAALTATVYGLALHLRLPHKELPPWRESPAVWNGSTWVRTSRPLSILLIHRMH